MSDPIVEALNTAPQGGGEGGQGGAQGTEPAALPEWMNGLPDDLRADQTLSRYKTVEDLAKGLRETQGWARGRVAIPAGDDDSAWNEFAQRMRPEKAEDYNIPVTGEDSAMADAFRAFAHDNGFHPRHAQRAAEFFNQYSADAISKQTAAAQAEVTSIELELGPQAYAHRLEATANMLRAAGLMDEGMDFVKGMTSAYGPGKTMRGLFALAEKTGELGKVDTTAIDLRTGGMTPQGAQGEINRLKGDKDFIAKASVPGSPEALRWKELNLRAAGG